MKRYMAGTPNKVEMPCSSIASRAAPGSKFRCRTTSPPRCIVTNVVTLSPPMWNSGAAARVVSPTAIEYSEFTLFHAMLPWVNMAPFGRPVVPDVYMIRATSSAPTLTPCARGTLVARTSSSPSQPSPALSAPTYREQGSWPRISSSWALWASSATTVCTPASLMM
ncbi:MAG TPA: hypothetical protein VII84_01885 [Acidimicrobiales bacterium]